MKNIYTASTQSTILNSAQVNYKYIVNPSIPVIITDTVTSSLAKNFLNTVIIDKFEKSCDKLIADLGDTITYTIIIDNIGTTLANDVIFIDTIPTDTYFVSDSLSFNQTTIPGNPNPPGLNIGSIDIGSSTITFKVVVDKIPSQNEILNVSTLEYKYTVDPSLPNEITKYKSSNIAKTQVNIVKVSVDLKVDKELVTCGEKVKYTAELFNYGNIDAINVTYVDTIPVEMEFIDDSFKINSQTILGANPNFGVDLTTIYRGSAMTITYEVRVIC